MVCQILLAESCVLLFWRWIIWSLISSSTWFRCTYFPTQNGYSFLVHQHMSTIYSNFRFTHFHAICITVSLKSSLCQLKVSKTHPNSTFHTHAIQSATQHMHSTHIPKNTNISKEHHTFQIITELKLNVSQ